ncbi:hydrolase [Pseudomonas sp. PDM14]|uniref:hydrolase n=1 Tax=Pseudomonas sp. PDM14 TaxID=2769288 RepID=UPI00178352C6|nr:hydrolase [Pseudomonas sp. PDM14]MBD9484566.1 hydrolase [Pseudomonas sp. PDM14]
MRNLLTTFFAVLLLCGTVIYALWTQEVPPSHYLSDLRSEIVETSGTPTELGNLLAISPTLHPSDYQRPRRLYLKLDAALRHARQAGQLDAHTVVVLPEQIGTWLVLADEKPRLYRAGSLDEAKPLLALNNPWALLRTWLSAEQSLNLRELLLRMKAQQAADAYLQVFGALAREHRVILRAGSILLPSPRLVDGSVRTGNGALHNFALTFAADGSILGAPLSQALHKHPAAQEQVLGDSGLTLRSQAIPGATTYQLHAAGAQASVSATLGGQLWAVRAADVRVEMRTASQAQGPTRLHNTWLTR